MTTRRPDYSRNLQLEALLKETNVLLGQAESSSLKVGNRPEQPVVLVMGAPRSGTTLFMQWLASCGAVAYPTNLMARFYEAPAIGARIQRLLTDPDYAFRDELFNLQEPLGFESDLGKTRGALAPNEFWYFWRRFFPLEIPEPLSAHQLEHVGSDLFLAELAALTAFYQRPFAMKGMLLNFNIEFLARLSSKFIFVHLVREPVFNAQSLLQARIAYYGDVHQWYSTKPPEYAWLKDLEPSRQVAGQCLFTNRAITTSLSTLAEKQCLSVGYESFCSEPEQVFVELVTRMNAQGADVKNDYAGPKAFSVRNEVVLPDQAFAQLEKACAEFTPGNDNTSSVGGLQ